MLIFQAELEAELTARGADVAQIVADGTISDNLLYLEIYYEALNFEKMEEGPAYDVSTANVWSLGKDSAQG